MPNQGWIVEVVGGVELLRCGLLLEVPGVAHAFSTRREPGGASFDLGRAGEVDRTTVERRRRLCRAAGFGDGPPVVLEQVHGDVVWSAGAEPPRGSVEADGALACRPETWHPVLSVRTADCLPVLLADEAGSAVAAVHAGWRGTARGIVGRAVASLVAQGLSARRLRAALGPVAGPCCYEVGPDVLGAIGRASGVDAKELQARSVHGGVTLDLAEANRRQLLAAGIPGASISVVGECTMCSGRYFSYRREGSSAGRQMALIGWAAAPGSSRGPGRSLTTAPSSVTIHRYF